MTMIYVIVITIALLALAKRGRRKRAMGRYIRGTVDEELDLGTLAARTAILAIFDNVVNERTLVSSLVGTWSLSDWTVATGDGPVLVGVCHSDYNSAEVEEYLEQTQSWNEGNMIAQEINKRKIRRIGVFESPIGGVAADSIVLNDGRPIKTKLNWILLQGQSLNIWAYNQGGSAFATTNPTLRLAGHANLFPK